MITRWQHKDGVILVCRTVTGWQHGMHESNIRKLVIKYESSKIIVFRIFLVLFSAR